MIFCGKAEFVIYKVKKMKIMDKDVNPIANQFAKLDPTYSGRITLKSLGNQMEQFFYNIFIIDRTSLFSEVSNGTSIEHIFVVYVN